MFGRFKGMKFRGDVSIYMHQLTGISRNSFARFTELNNTLLDNAASEGLDIHDAGIRLAMRFGIERLVCISAGSASPLIQKYGEAYLNDVLQFSQYGTDFLKVEHNIKILQGTLVMNNSSGINPQFDTLLDQMVMQDTLSNDFVNELRDGSASITGPLWEEYTSGLPDWAKL